MSSSTTDRFVRGCVELAALVGLVAACGAGPRGPGRDAWKRARTVAEAHLQQKYGEPPAWEIEREHEGTPFLFHVRSPGEFAILVHHDAVFTQNGLAGLDRYLRESRCVEQRTTNVNDVMTLLELLDALPPYEHRTEYVERSADHKAWRPRLDFLDGGNAEFHVFYIVQDEDPGDGDGEETETDLIEWTLTMEPGQMPVWRDRRRVWNNDRAAWTDVDHAN